MPHRITELHCIMPIANVPSVMAHGILSYERAARLAHHSVAMSAVQDRRDTVQVPGGLKLHQYANLYFHARNPMMFSRQDRVEALCVLQVSPDVLALPEVVITDQNASSSYVRFLGGAQMGLINFDRVYARDWRSTDQVTYWRQKAAKCAEVLVPGVVEPEYVRGAYVVSEAARHELIASGFVRSVTIDSDLFFQ